MTCVHASLPRPEDFVYAFDSARALETAVACGTPLCWVGHTHRPAFYAVDTHGRRVRERIEDADRLQAVQVPPQPDTVYVVNPGSVGQPRDGDHRASAMIYDDEDRSIQAVRAEYDVAAAQQKIRAAGLPAFLAERLVSGW